MPDAEPQDGDSLLDERLGKKRRQRKRIRAGCLAIVAISLGLSIFMRDGGYALAWLPCCLAPFAFFLYAMPIMMAEGGFEDRRIYDDSILTMKHGISRLGKSNSILLWLLLIPARIVVAGAVLFLSVLGCSVPYCWASLGGRRGREWLAARLSADNPYDRWRACRYIKYKATLSEAPALERRLSDSESYVAEAAIDALAQIPGYEPSAKLREAAESDDDVIRLQAVSSLHLLRQPVEFDEALLTRVVNLMNFDEIGESERLLEMLKPLPPEKVVRTLVDLYEDQPDCRHGITLFVSERDYGPEALKLIHRSLASEEMQLARGGLLAARQRGTEETLPLLRRFLDEPAGELQREASWAEKAILKRMSESAAPITQA